LVKTKSAVGNSEEIVGAIVAGMKEKKANRIITIDLRDISNPLADFFVICSGTSDFVLTNVYIFILK
jgi:ribosome-associated protein